MKMRFFQQKNTIVLLRIFFNPEALNVCQVIFKNMSEIGNAIVFQMKKCTETLCRSRST